MSNNQGTISQITTYDFYEAAYYLTQAYDLLSIEIVYELGKQRIKMHFSGFEIGKSQSEYLRSNAYVNLFEFRRAYQRLQSMIFAEKRRLKEGENI